MKMRRTEILIYRNRCAVVVFLLLLMLHAVFGFKTLWIAWLVMAVKKLGNALAPPSTGTRRWLPTLPDVKKLKRGSNVEVYTKYEKV